MALPTRMRTASRTAWATLCLLAVIGLAAKVEADPVGDFYRGKTMHVVIGFGVGGGYDTYGRLVAEFLGRHIPGNPTIIPQNMTGAGGFVAAAYLYNIAPRDGTYLGIAAETLALDTAIAKEQDKKLIDARQLPYIGRITTNVEVGAAKPGSNIKSFEDAKTRPIVVGASGPASATNIFPLALNKFAGAKFKMVRGYTSVNEILLAEERGEVELVGAVGLPYLLTAHPDWVLAGKAAIIYQAALRRHHLLPNVPLLPELAVNDEGRLVLRAIASISEIGKSIQTTPDVPPERLGALRRAFQDMLRDADFLAATENRNIMIDAGTGEEMDAIVQETMQLPRSILDTLADLLRE